MGDSPKGGSSLWNSSAWRFGSLVKSITAKSEEVLHAYQKDLQEFGAGLKKETEAAAVVTAHAVKDHLPLSLESSAAVAQESLEAVGQTIEEFGSSFWRGTAELIGQVKEAVKKVDEDAESSETPTGTSRRYNRFETQLIALQSDSSTYCEEPEDQRDFIVWQQEFDLDGREKEIESVREECPFVQELESRLVPANVTYAIFWTRYFYHVNKLQQAEDARAHIVKRATSTTEEDLSWEVDEDEVEVDEKENSVVEEVAAAETTAMATTAVTAEATAAATALPTAAGVEEEGDEAKSDNSTGSEWLVVQDDKDSVDSASTALVVTETATGSRDESGADSKEERKKDEDWGEWE